MSNFLKEAGTKYILKLIKELENRLNSSLHDTNILSTVSECTASTNANDVAGASALSELNDSLKTKALFDKGNNGANYFYENTYTSMIVPYSTSWDYEGIAPAWYFVIIIHFSGGNTMQYWLALTGSSIYTRRTNNSGATWTVTKLH